MVYTFATTFEFGTVASSKAGVVGCSDSVPGTPRGFSGGSAGEGLVGRL